MILSRLCIAVALVLGVGPASAADPGWTVDPSAFEFDMTVIAVFRIDGTESNDSNDKLAAFVGGEVRGVATGSQVFGRNMYFLTIFSDDPAGETITFKAYDASADVVFDMTETVSFLANGMHGSTGDPFELNNATVSEADLAIQKTDGAASTTAGSQVTYTITVSNAGPDDVAGASVSDNLPASLTGATWACAAAGGAACSQPSGTGDISTTADLPAGGTATYTVIATLGAGASGTLANTASVAPPAGVTDPQAGNNSATDVNSISREANLGITKTDGATSVAAGSPVTYTVVASNAGPSDVSGAVVADDLPSALTGATWTCAASGGAACGQASGSGDLNTTADVPVGGTATYTVTATLQSGASGTLSNTATVGTPTGISDPQSSNNSATDATTITHEADLAITKNDGAASVAAGSSVTYTITATNAGPSNADAVVIVDDLPATLNGATWTCSASVGAECGQASGSGDINTSADLPAGGTATYTVTATVPSNATGVLSNTASISAPAGVSDPQSANNEATDVTTITTTSADLAVTKTDGLSSVAAGSQITYTIVVSNAGPSAVVAASVVDNLPSSLENASWTCTPSSGASCGHVSGTGSINTTVNLPSGKTATYKVTATVKAGASGTISNTALVATPSGISDPNADDNSATDFTSISGEADLAVAKTDGADAVGAGTQIIYTIAVVNAGPSDVYGAIVVDDLPSILTGATWLCVAADGAACGAASGTGDLHTTADLPVGKSATYTVTATLDDHATGAVSNTASVAVPTGVSDPHPDNNTATDVSEITGDADISVVKTADNTQPNVDETVTFVIKVENNGPGAVGTLKVTDLLPAGLRNAAASVDQGTYSLSTGVWNIGSLAAGSHVELTVTAEVAVSSWVTNTAAVSFSSAHDPIDSNNASSVTITPREQTGFWTSANADFSTVTAFGRLSGLPSKSGTTTLFLGTDGGGLLRSIDEGFNWHPTAFSGGAVRSTALDAAANVLYVATYGGGLHSLSNAGDVATAVFGSTTALTGGGFGTDQLWSVAVNNAHPNDANRDVFVGTDGIGVIFNNTGSSWKNVSGNLPSAARRAGTLLIRPDGESAGKDRIYMGSHGRGVWYLDYSQVNATTPNWKSANGSQGTLAFSIVFDLDFDGTTFFAATSTGLYQTTDPVSGTWTQVPELAGKVVRAVLAYGAGKVFAGTDGHYLFRSVDGGASYQQIIRAAPGESPWWGFTGTTILSLFRTDDGILFAGSQDDGAYRSEDDGLTWHQVTNEPLVTVIQALAFDIDGETLFGGTQGHGVIRADHFGASSSPSFSPLPWLQANNGLGNLEVHALLDYERHGTEYLFAGTWQGGVYRSDNDAKKWTFVGLNERIVYDLAVCPSSGHIFATTDHGQVARSTDNGLFWSEIGAATTAIISFLVNPSNCNELYAGTFGAGVLKSEDGGFTWDRTGMTSGYAFDFAFDDDGGVSGRNRVYVGTATGVKFTDDGGTTWQDLSTGLTVPDTRVLLTYETVGGNDVLIAGTWGGGVFLYDEDVHAWVRDGLPTAAPILALAMSPKGEVVASDNAGTVYRKHFPPPAPSGSLSTDSENESALPTEFALMSNYPNPFNPTTTIRFELPKASPVRLVVYDVLGRQVQVLVDGVRASGVHDVRFDAGDLPSGIYVYRLETSGRDLARSMMLMK